MYKRSQISLDPERGNMNSAKRIRLPACTFIVLLMVATTPHASSSPPLVSIFDGQSDRSGWTLLTIDLASSILTVEVSANFPDTEFAAIGTVLYNGSGPSVAAAWSYGVAGHEGDAVIRVQESTVSSPRMGTLRLGVPPSVDPPGEFTEMSHSWTIGCESCATLPAHAKLLIYVTAPEADWTYRVRAQDGSAAAASREGTNVFAIRSTDFSSADGLRAEFLSRQGRVGVNNISTSVHSDGLLVATFRNTFGAGDGLTATTPEGAISCPCGPLAFEPYSAADWNYTFRMDRLSYDVGLGVSQNRSDAILFGAVVDVE